MSRYYVDTRIGDPRAPYGCWELRVTYYTGGMDKVPHIPKTCLVQAGATVLGESKVPFRIRRASGAWGKEFLVNRTRYAVTSRGGVLPEEKCQYYIFSLNGRPEDDWKAVRWELMKPTVRYCYFASIYFLPLSPVDDYEECDRRAREFANYMLPDVLKMLPTPADVERCASANE